MQALLAVTSDYNGLSRSRVKYKVGRLKVLVEGLMKLHIKRKRLQSGWILTSLFQHGDLLLVVNGNHVQKHQCLAVGGVYTVCSDWKKVDPSL